jgi:hypothetical protein
MSFRKLTMAAVAAVAVSVAAGSANAATILVMGQAGGPLFTGTNVGNNSPTATLSVTNGTVNITELGGVAGSTPAFFNLTATSVAPAVTVGTTVLQDFGLGSFSITSGVNGTGVNYLSGTFSLATLSGSGQSGGTTGSTFAGSTINYTSDVIANMTTPFAFSFSFTNVSPPFSVVTPNGGGTSFAVCGPTPSICSFTASYSGEFAADQFTRVPVPAALAVFGMGLLGLGVVARRKAA